LLIFQQILDGRKDILFRMHFPLSDILLGKGEQLEYGDGVSHIFVTFGILDDGLRFAVLGDDHRPTRLVDLFEDIGGSALEVGYGFYIVYNLHMSSFGLFIVLNLDLACKCDYELLLSPDPFALKKRLLDQVREMIRLKHYSLKTERSYIGWINR
jgi:hypothetical protein